MLLLTGPPASGKTSSCVDRVREHLRSGDRNWRLLVPTATLGEHLRDQLARERFVFAPGCISTLAKFVDGLVPDLPRISDAGLEIITEEVLARDCPARYLPVRDFAGFRRALASTIEEFTSMGGTQAEGDFGAVLHDVVALIHLRGRYLQAERLKMAQGVLIGDQGAYYLAGFYSFSEPELGFLRTLAEVAEVTVTLPEWLGSEAALRSLRTFATERSLAVAARKDVSEPRGSEAVKKPDTGLEACATSIPACDCENVERRRDFFATTLVTAPTLDAELTEIARRLCAEHAAGRRWRDMGIIVRSEEPYVPALRSALERFGIPARFYFGTPLAQHPVIRCFSTLVDAMLAGWDHAILLEALRLPGSPLEHDDHYDYEIRERLPGNGLDNLRHPIALDKLTAWTPATPAIWQERFRSLRELWTASTIRDRIPHEMALLHRSHAAALDAWEEAVDEAAAALEATTITCERFWHVLKTVLASAALRPLDHRRDVVHIIDAFEARQWRLPVVFICGLVEKQFPKYHSENPIIPLRTSAERHSEEQFLFDVALTRATESVILSYPTLNAKAESNLPSFFIERARPFDTVEAVDARPAPRRIRAPEPYAGIFDDGLRAQLAIRHNTIAASSIEWYLQCPYQFYARRTLRLAEPPADPYDRLNVLLQGSIAHTVLERVYREKRNVRDVFDDVFAEHATKERIPPGYRTEAVRLDLMHNLELLVRDERLAPAARSLYEQKFDLPLGDGAIVTGRIDRIEIDSAGRATVIDYKYSGKLSVARAKNGHDEQTHVQGGLYLLALSRLGDFTPAGMVYCGFKREVSFGGWIIRPYYMELKEDCTEERLREVMQAAREAALNAAAAIRSGNIMPKPADETRCQFCEFARMCRVEKVAAAAVMGGAATL